jgi:hypothetical protein
MSVKRTLGFALALLFAAGAAHAQHTPASPRPDTLTIVKGESPVEVRLRLTTVGAHVLVLKGGSQLVADTMEISTPVQVVLPAQSFSLHVSASPDAMISILSDSTPQPKRGRFRSTFHAPFTLARTAPNGALMLQSASMTSQRVP